MHKFVLIVFSILAIFSFFGILLEGYTHWFGVIVSRDVVITEVRSYETEDTTVYFMLAKTESGEECKIPGNFARVGDRITVYQKCVAEDCAVDGNDWYPNRKEASRSGLISFVVMFLLCGGSLLVVKTLASHGK